MDFALKNAKSYNKQLITRKVVQYGCIFTRQIYFFSPKSFEKIKIPAVLHNIQCNNLYVSNDSKIDLQFPRDRIIWPRWFVGN